jgi:predicted ATPase
MIDKKWFSFEDLSDGTKRIFYIISEIFILDRNNFKLTNDPTNNNLNVIFIEEPELGIHPHQLFRLMNFLKEKSRSNQIIITTHSPLSLDILEINELDSILIAEKLDGQTQLKKLSKEKIEKAKMYMNDLNLSDFWLNSDLED